MRKVNFIVLALVATYLLAPPLALGQSTKGGGNVEQQIKVLTDQMAQAQLKGDTSFYEKYYADDVLVIHSPGTLGTKAEEIGDLKSGALKYDSYEVRDIKIHAYNGDTAVVDYVASTKGVLKGKAFNGDFRVSRVWIKQKGNWKVVLFQTARIASSQ